MTPLIFFQDLCWHSLIFFIVTVVGYLAAASSLYWALYLRPSSRFAIAAAHRSFKSSWAKSSWATLWPAIRSDVILSVLSSGIFALCAAVMMTAYTLGYTRLYLEPAQYGLWYLGVSLVLVLVLQDAYFYFTHRLSHHPKCYQWLHKGHHHCKNPTPFTAFAFDPGEAMIQAIYLIGVTLLIPMHISVLSAVVMVMTLGALIHHFGVRLFEGSALGKWLGSWMVGTSHHWLHHRKYTMHYSLYFTFWDRVMGTQYPGYVEVLTPRPETLTATTSEEATTTGIKTEKGKNTSLSKVL
ncbi:MAG: sterol desaturase family protein [Cyanobacteria bacterium P01_F01_bin.53]